MDATVQSSHTWFTKSLLPRLYIGWIVLLAVGYFAALIAEAEVLIPICWGLMGSSGIAAVLYGLQRNQVTERAPWYFFAAAMTLFIIGDCYVKALNFVYASANPFPSFADALYLMTYPLFGIGLYLLIRTRSKVRGRGSILDALTLTTSLGLFVWVYLIAPTIGTDASLLARIVSVSYPLGDVLVWAFLISLLTVDLRTRAIQFLAFGALGLITSDIAYALGLLHGTWNEGNIFDLGWIIFYSCWGLAALHPSVAKLGAQAAQGGFVIIRPWRLATLALAALVAPIILLIETIHGNAGQVAAPISIFAGLLFVLVILRLFTLTRTLSKQEAAIELSQEKDELLAITSHQLRTPLTVIQLSAETILASHDPVQTNKYVQVIAQSNERMIKIVNQLVYTAELDTGEIQFKTEAVPVYDVVQQAIKDTSALLLEKHIELRTAVPMDLPPVRGDRGAIATILAGVLTNAAQYGTDSSPRVDITARMNGDEVVLAVVDNGHGIPLADQGKLFTKLFRGSNARRMAPDGSGLSLYLARAVLTRMNGAINIASNEGKGTTASISLAVAA